MKKATLKKTIRQHKSASHLVTTSPKLTKSKISKKFYIIIAVELVIMIAIAGFLRWQSYKNSNKVIYSPPTKQLESTNPPKIDTGKIVSTEPAQNFTAAQTLERIRQNNRNFDLPVTQGHTKQTYVYTSSDGIVNDVPIYARVYVPSNIGTKKLPVLAFAPGTIGIGDACGGSLEQPAKRNWANYDSLMAAYASQGYIVVITDYEGLRDPSRIHHYMVGDIEGRAVLDSIHSLENLELSKNNIDENAIFTGGYSQGGHAAFWADAIASKYAPDIKLRGAIGFGPVTSVNETLTDAITNNANINWFGPFVLTSYQDWYKREYPVNRILLPQWIKSLQTDVSRECIDTVNRYWPNNLGVNRSANIYTQEFIAAAKTGNLASNKIYAQFMADMESNIVGPIKTDTPKLINQGMHDNVVLPRQNLAGYARLCASGNTTNLKEYTTSKYAVQSYNPQGLVDHYQTMNASFKDTLVWMNDRISGIAVSGSCK